MSLRTKFHFASFGIILVIVLGMMITLILSEKKRLMSEIEQQQVEDLDKLAKVCHEVMMVLDEPALLNYAMNLVNLSSSRVSYAGVINEDGSAWLVSADRKFSLVDAQDSAIKEVTQSRHFLRREVSFEGKPVTEISKPAGLNGQYGYVRLGYSQKYVTEMFRKTIAEYVMQLLLLGLIAIAVGLIIAQIMSTALTRPIANLMEAAESIAEGEKGVKIPVTTTDEMGRLTDTFNHMSDELGKLDQMKDDFMSHVTHELRSPLTSIIATAELMAEMPQMESDPKYKRSVDRLIYGSERLNKLVDNILDLTRMEAGKMQFDIKPVDIRTLLKEMAEFFEPRAAEKNLTIKAETPSGEFPQALADPERIRQVISNLIHNAIKFTNAGGITLRVAEAHQMIQVSVQDTGVGIPADKLKTVFEKFECLKDTRDRVNKPVPGSGLGLNIVLNSIKAQGGSIWVESEVNKGSAFIFTLPKTETMTVVSSTPNTNSDNAPLVHAAEAERQKMPIMMIKKEAHV